MIAAAAELNVKREFPLLARLGADDLPGAVMVVPSDEHGHTTELPAQEAEPEHPAQPDPLRKFSLAGLQLKFSVQKDNRGWTIPVSGQAGNEILKLPDSRPGYQGVPEAEFAAMTLAAAAGINTPAVELVDARQVKGLGQGVSNTPGLSFAVSRFDRTSTGQRVHAEELAQILDIPTNRSGGARDPKYTRANFETIAGHISNLVGPSAVAEVIRRIVLNVLVGNGDAHLKNWKIIYPDGSTPELSPVYDVVPTVLFIPDDHLGLNLNGSKQFTAVTSASFGPLGERSGLSAAEVRTVVAASVEAVMANWPLLRELLPAAKYQALTERLGSLPLVSARAST
jgi:serine/threonine-protein kinase HipA